jgi:lipoprotein NlpD
MHKGLFLIILSLQLLACDKRDDLAPVTESKWQSSKITTKKHEVLPGETLYAIAFRHDEDYRRLANINNLQSPYTLKVGQVLDVKPNSANSGKIAAKPIKKTLQAAPAKAKEKQINYSSAGLWLWPAQGKMVNNFAPEKGKKGIDIAGSQKEKVRAASSGLVAYSGNGLSGYGNLIIIKHNNQYLTAYGNNSKNFVKEGQQVKQGQVIAQMGRVNHKFWGLHFEIRKSGKPVNPLKYLKKA